MVTFRAFQTRNNNYLPWQAPPLSLWGVPKPRQGLYAVLFWHLRKNLLEYRKPFLALRVGDLWYTGGDSMRPTMTGNNEVIYVSMKYSGGRGVQVGDAIVVVGIEWRSRGEKTVKHILKRIVGLPGHKQHKKGLHAWHQVSVRYSQLSQPPISDLRRHPR